MRRYIVVMKKLYKIIILTCVVLVFGMTACSSKNEPKNQPLTEETYTDDMFYWEDEQLLYIDGSSAYYYVPEKNMYYKTSRTENGLYGTYLDENNNAYFTTFDEDFNFYIDFPNDSKGLVMVRKAEKPEERNDDDVYYVDENGAEYYIGEHGEHGVRYKVEGEWVPYDNGDVDIEELSFEQAQKISALSVIHDSAVKRYEEK